VLPDLRQASQRIGLNGAGCVAAGVCASRIVSRMVPDGTKERTAMRSRTRFQHQEITSRTGPIADVAQ